MSCFVGAVHQQPSFVVGQRLAGQRLDRAHEARPRRVPRAAFPCGRSARATGSSATRSTTPSRRRRSRRGPAAPSCRARGRSVSASGVVGPFAPSSTIFALTARGVVGRQDVLERRRDEDVARRARARRPDVDVLRAGEVPESIRWRGDARSTASGSSPFALAIAPSYSAMATTIAPRLVTELGGVIADVAEALHDRRACLRGRA